MAHVDLEAPREILLSGIFGAYVMEEPRTLHDLFTFTISWSGEITGAQPRSLPNNVKLILKLCVMAGQSDGQGKLLLNTEITSTLLVCGNVGR